MNFPRKKPMKMAAMTTRREGREAALASRPRRLLEFDVTWSERGTFLSRTLSSYRQGDEEVSAVFQPRLVLKPRAFVMLGSSRAIFKVHLGTILEFQH